MKIEIWQIGKKRDDVFEDCNEIYLKRMKSIHQIKFVHYKEKDHKNFSPIQIKTAESEAMVKKFESKSFKIVLDEKGKQLDSVDFANKLKSVETDASFDKIVFCIGGAYGFDEKIHKVANFSISLSKMTFPHRMVKLFLLEQLYRAHTINSNHKYHKY